MRAFLLLSLISFMDMPACDLTGGPEHVQKQAEIQVRIYFPNGRVIVSPQEATIFALTCAHGLGKPLVEEIDKSLEKSRGIQQLHHARQLPLKLSPYRFFVLVFDEYVIRLDTDTQQHWIFPSNSQTNIHYEATCGNERGSSAFTGEKPSNGKGRISLLLRPNIS